MDNNSQQPDDHKVEHAILITVANLEKPVRPNKLRKIICNQVKGCNWTQYQRILDSMMKEKKSIHTCFINNEEMISPNQKNDSMSSSLIEDDRIGTINEDSNDTPTTTGRTSSQSNKNQPNVISVDIKVPLAIVYHLVRKGKKKQKSIEENTKTKFTFSNESLMAVKTKGFDSNEMCSFTISSLHDDIEEISAKKHVKTAKILMNKMVKSFELNPDHFNPRQAGGTFKEQEEAKKRKLEARQKAISKKRDNADYDVGHNEATVKKKRKKKFY
jgi:hypothetical protein